MHVGYENSLSENDVVYVFMCDPWEVSKYPRIDFSLAG